MKNSKIKERKNSLDPPGKNLKSQFTSKIKAKSKRANFKYQSTFNPRGQISYVPTYIWGNKRPEGKISSLFYIGVEVKSP